jgi:hypothetical protein
MNDHLTRIRHLFEEQTVRHGLAGVIGVASFASTVTALLPVQRQKARDLLGSEFDSFVDRGSVICLAYAYPEIAIDAIANQTGTGYDKIAWNYYAREYGRVNAALSQTAQELARLVDGATVDATLPGMIKKVTHIEEYYPLVISHRVAAEQSGVGWRGKHQLIVNHPLGLGFDPSSVGMYASLQSGLRDLSCVSGRVSVSPRAGEVSQLSRAVSALHYSSQPR